MKVYYKETNSVIECEKCYGTEFKRHPNLSHYLRCLKCSFTQEMYVKNHVTEIIYVRNIEELEEEKLRQDKRNKVKK